MKRQQQSAASKREQVWIERAVGTAGDQELEQFIARLEEHIPRAQSALASALRERKRRRRKARAAR